MYSIRIINETDSETLDQAISSEAEYKNLYLKSVKQVLFIGLDGEDEGLGHLCKKALIFSLNNDNPLQRDF